jgi:uncharacterized membrane protein
MVANASTHSSAFADRSNARDDQPGGASPTYPAPNAPSLSPVLERNIETLFRRREREATTARWQDRVADIVTRFTGSMTFVGIHLAVFGGWIIANLGWVPGLKPWDPSFVVLAMVASVEAIFLSTFVLITQNRMAASADKRADLDLQISLLTEHEITKMAALLSRVALQAGVTHDQEFEEIKRDVAPEAVLDTIEEAEKS